MRIRSEVGRIWIANLFYIVFVFLFILFDAMSRESNESDRHDIVVTFPDNRHITTRRCDDGFYQTINFDIYELAIRVPDIS